MKRLKTKLVKIGDNEYRIDDHFSINFTDGSVVDYDYGLDFEKWINNIDDYQIENPDEWEKLILNEFEVCGIEPITVWTKLNDFSSYTSTDPLCNFGERISQLSENAFANLLLYMFETNLFDKDIIYGLGKFSHHYNPTDVESIVSSFNNQKEIPIEIYRYGFQNRIVIFINPKHFDINKIPEYNRWLYKNI